MNIEQNNRDILSLDDSHPAKKFLLAFIECRDNCVGRHHSWTEQIPVDQAWVSSDGKAWLFSDYAYIFLSMDLIIDGYPFEARNLTDSELRALHQISIMRSLMKECSEAAKHDGNVEILKMTDQVLEMLRLWEEFVRYRESDRIKKRGRTAL